MENSHLRLKFWEKNYRQVLDLPFEWRTKATIYQVYITLKKFSCFAILIQKIHKQLKDRELPVAIVKLKFNLPKFD